MPGGGGGGGKEIKKKYLFPLHKKKLKKKTNYVVYINFVNEIDIKMRTLGNAFVNAPKKSLPKSFILV